MVSNLEKMDSTLNREFRDVLQMDASSIPQPIENVTSKTEAMTLNTDFGQFNLTTYNHTAEILNTKTQHNGFLQPDYGTSIDVETVRDIRNDMSENNVATFTKENFFFYDEEDEDFSESLEDVLARRAPYYNVDRDRRKKEILDSLDVESNRLQSTNDFKRVPELPKDSLQSPICVLVPQRDTLESPRDILELPKDVVTNGGIDALKATKDTLDSPIRFLQSPEDVFDEDFNALQSHNGPLQLPKEVIELEKVDELAAELDAFELPNVDVTKLQKLDGFCEIDFCESPHDVIIKASENTFTAELDTFELPKKVYHSPKKVDGSSKDDFSEELHILNPPEKVFESRKEVFESINDAFNEECNVLESPSETFGSPTMFNESSNDVSAGRLDFSQSLREFIKSLNGYAKPEKSVIEIFEERMVLKTGVKEDQTLEQGQKLPEPESERTDDHAEQANVINTRCVTESNEIEIDVSQRCTNEIATKQASSVTPVLDTCTPEPTQKVSTVLLPKTTMADNAFEESRQADNKDPYQAISTEAVSSPNTENTPTSSLESSMEITLEHFDVDNRRLPELLENVPVPKITTNLVDIDVSENFDRSNPTNVKAITSSDDLESDLSDNVPFQAISEGYDTLPGSHIKRNEFIIDLDDINEMDDLALTALEIEDETDDDLEAQETRTSPSDVTGEHKVDGVNNRSQSSLKSCQASGMTANALSPTVIEGPSSSGDTNLANSFDDENSSHSLQRNFDPIELLMRVEASSTTKDKVVDRDHERMMNEFYDLVRGVQNWTPGDWLTPGEYCDLIRQQSLPLVMAANRTIQTQKKEISEFRKENYLLKETMYGYYAEENNRLKRENKRLKESISKNKELYIRRETQRTEQQCRCHDNANFYVNVGSKKTSLFGRFKKLFGRIKRIFTCKKIEPMM
ncbi:uncharacterized protein [Clytia hemisphaerica]|uniref:Uncharacterized protein n=1 Tax=Clytia hemisphaerica TaxID=252671 RepID=A0A7M5XLU8_9CNID